MKETVGHNLVIFISAIFLVVGFSFSSKLQAHVAEISPNTEKIMKESVPEKVDFFTPRDTFTHKKTKRWLHGKPAIVNIITVDPKASQAIVKPSYGSYFINTVRSVKKIVELENAIAGVNASYFKPDNGVPLGASIVNGNVVTGNIYRRTVFGVTKDKEFKMDKIDITGEIKIGNDIKLWLFNINQPVFSTIRYTVFTSRWGKYTPKTSSHYVHIIVENDRVSYIKQSSVPIPKNGYVIVGPHSRLPKSIRKNDKVSYSIDLIPKDWNDVEYAIGGGPYLVKDGKIFIDRQKFSKSFLWQKEPRTAVGYTKAGTLVLVTVDGRQKGISEGASLSELAQIMWEQGVYNAMNLDGGTSTQMVVNGKLVSTPSVKGGTKVTNALVIIVPKIFENLSLLP